MSNNTPALRQLRDYTGKALQCVSTARASFAELGKILGAIRDQHLFEADGHANFSDYLKATPGLDMSDSQACRIIQASRLLPKLPKPAAVANWQWNESAMRSLHRLEDPVTVAERAAQRATDEGIAIGTAVRAVLRDDRKPVIEEARRESERIRVETEKALEERKTFENVAGDLLHALDRLLREFEEIGAEVEQMTGNSWHEQLPKRDYYIRELTERFGTVFGYRMERIEASKPSRKRVTA